MAWRVSSSLLAACLLVAVTGGAAFAERGGVDPEALMEKFYAWYPCVTPAEAINMAQASPKAAYELFDYSRTLRERLAGYHLIVAARVPGFQAVIKAATVDRSSRLRSAAIRDLDLVLAGEELVAVLIGSLGDSCLAVRYGAAEELANYPSNTSISALFEVLDDMSIETRHLAAWTLRRWDRPEITAEVRKLAHSDDVVLAGVANYLLAGLPDERIDIAALNQYLRHELPKLTGPPYSGVDNVSSLIDMIATVGDTSSLPTLKQAANHPHRNIQKAALRAIAVLQATDPERNQRPVLPVRR